MKFFRQVLKFSLIFLAALIVLDGIDILAISIGSEIFISVIVVVLADIVAIIHSFVKYMNNLEHYTVYNGLIDSLLKHLNRERSV